MSGRLQPAFWGGLFIGVLSALPIVKFGNVCCCLWVIAGGALAAWLAQSNQPHPLKAAEGALLGLLAGIIGAVIAFPINLLFEDFERGWLLRLIETTDAEIPPELRGMLENGTASAIGRVFSLLTSLVLNAVFGLLGGLLGAAVFKKTPPTPPPGTVEVLPPL
jgi:uncharacterized membrane protein YeaQ/YmgE (transglycosylase-associated protein family)